MPRHHSKEGASPNRASAIKHKQRDRLALLHSLFSFNSRLCPLQSPLTFLFRLSVCLPSLFNQGSQMPPRRSNRAAATHTSPASTDKTTTTKTTAATSRGASTKTSATAKTISTAKTAGAINKTAASSTTAKEPKPKPARTTPAASKKRKAAADEAEPAPESKKSRVAKPRAPPAPKPKVVINQAPKTKLNVYVCGEGSSGELGLGSAKTSIDVKRPRLNALLSAEKVGVVQVAVGGMHCVALTHDNKILTWGVNDQGALGRDTTWEGGYKDIDENKSHSDSESEGDPDLNPYESTPTAIPASSFPKGTIFVEVAAGDSSSFALTDDGKVYGWGTFRVRAHGQLLHSTLTGSRATMVSLVLTLLAKSSQRQPSSRR